MGGKYVGAEVRRREDPRLLTGRGQYVDDLPVAACLHAAIVRSPHAHARIAAIRADAARRVPGVVAVFALDDLRAQMAPLPAAGVPPPALQSRVGFTIKPTPQYPLAGGTVRYVGEPVAIVVAEDRYVAEDALHLVEADWEPLPAVADAERGVAAGAPLIHPELGDNVAVEFRVAIGDVERAFAGAPVVVRRRIRVQRYAGMPLEPRGVLAVPDARGGLTVRGSTQVPHWLQRVLVEALGKAAHQVRVAAPDVGGGFGTKCSIYPEDVLVPLVAERLGRPLKWIETRREHLESATHSREQLHDVEIAATRDGEILGLRDRFLLDQGAYNPWGIVQPYNTVGHMLGPFRIRNFAVHARSVVTNKTPHAPYRGAGRPEAVFVVDRIVDSLARELGLDPAEVRRRNFVRADELPWDVGLLYRDGHPLVYDSADFPAALEAALGAIGYDAFRREQATLRARGIWRGAGISAYVEGTGIGPYEGATVRLDPTGHAVVATGACSQGQGHETVFAQIAADALGLPLERVTVVGGDTGAIPFGIGTFASRSLVLAGNAIAEAGRRVRERVVAAAAKLLEVSPADLEVVDGRVSVRGVPDRALTFVRVIQASLPTFAGPGVAEPVFEATTYHTVPTVTYASAVHAALVEVDLDTGRVTLLRYAVAHDCGRVVNPMIVEGQIHGGVAQGIGGGLHEEILYDDRGQLLTATLMEYHVPTAAEVPFIETVHLELPSPRNPLGVKGVGEGGAIAPPAAIANAVEDALAPLGVRITEAPVTAPRLCALIAAARADRNDSSQRAVPRVR
ncbi:MAG: xanthine dehydrogenase family protein [Candidatus Rokubacteria bacterium]|nr:xanthine dehydrogenase family protein [Candidatus Rokubacteria bacterium]